MENGKEPIYPHLVHTRSGEVQEYNKGLTKREYAAIMALQGILSSRELQLAIMKDKMNFEEYAVEISDRLLKQLEQK